MRRKPTLSMFQIVIVIASTSFGVAVLSFPRFMAESADTGAPLLTVSGIIGPILMLIPLTLLGRRFGSSIFDYGEKLCGKWLARLFNSLLFIYFTLAISLGFRQFGDVLTAVVFRKTPIEICIVLILLITAVACRRNELKFSYIHLFYFPFSFLPFLLIIFILLPRISTLNLQPVLGMNAEHWGGGMIKAAAPYLTTFIITILIPIMSKPSKAMKSGLYGVMLSCFIYLVMVIAVLGVYGTEETKKLLYPTLELSRSLSLGGGVLERFDVIFIVIWFLAVFTTQYSNYYLATYALGKIISVSDLRLTSSFLLPYLLIIAMLPSHVLVTRIMMNRLEFIGIILLVGYPLLLLAISLIRKKGAAAHE